MTSEGLAALQKGAVGHPVHIRALQKWNPQTYITCYIFIDKFGVELQALAHGSKDQNFVDSKIEVDKCYQIQQYACVGPGKYTNKLTHPVNLKIGKATLINLTDDTPEIPHYYFSFGNYETLKRICDNKQVTTDYYGVFQGNIEDKTKKDGDPFIVFNLMDSSNEIVPVTLWKEIATSKSRFDRDAIETAKYPLIIAVTSMHVIKYSKRPTLQSTKNTFVFLDPQTPQIAALRDRLLNQETEGSNNSGNEVNQHTTTIAEIIEKQTSELSGQTFTCNANILEIVPTIDWFRNTCPACSYEIFQYGKNWFCPTDGQFDNAIYTYQISIVIDDTTAKLQVSLSHETATTMIGTQCSELRIIDATRSYETLLKEIESLKGRSATFHIQAYRETYTGKVRATVTKVTGANNQQLETNIATPSTMIPNTPIPSLTKTTKDQQQTSTSRKLDFTSPGTEDTGSKKLKKSN